MTTKLMTDREMDAELRVQNEFEAGRFDGEFAQKLDAEAVVEEMYSRMEWTELLETLQRIAPQHVADIREQIIEEAQ